MSQKLTLFFSIPRRKKTKSHSHLCRHQFFILVAAHSIHDCHIISAFLSCQSFENAQIIYGANRTMDCNSVSVFMYVFMLILILCELTGCGFSYHFSGLFRLWFTPIDLFYKKSMLIIIMEWRWNCCSFGITIKLVRSSKELAHFSSFGCFKKSFERSLICFVWLFSNTQVRLFIFNLLNTKFNEKLWMEFYLQLKISNIQYGWKERA